MLPVAALAVMARLAPRPKHLGRHSNGELAPLPETPNAVSSFSRETESHILPFEFSGDPAAAWSRLREVVATHPGLQIISEFNALLCLFSSFCRQFSFGYSGIQLLMYLSESFFTTFRIQVIQ